MVYNKRTIYTIAAIAILTNRPWSAERGNGGQGSGHAHWLALISDHSIQWRVARSLPTLDASTAMAHGWPKRGELVRINMDQPMINPSTPQPHGSMA